MNRIVVLGVAMFFALVGIALIGGENKAEAFFGRRGCNGCGGCDGGGHHCGGGYDCCGRKHHRRRCCGDVVDCGGCFGRKCHGRKRRCCGDDYGCYASAPVAHFAPGAPMKGGPIQGPVGPVGPEKQGPVGPVAPEKGAPVQAPFQAPAQAPVK